MQRLYLERQNEASWHRKHRTMSDLNIIVVSFEVAGYST